MSSYSRPVLLLLCGLLLLTVAMAVLNTLVPLWLSHEQLPTWQVGLVSSSYFMGNLVGTLVAGAVIMHSGFNRSYHYACTIFALSTAALSFSTDIWSWLALRFLAGVGCAMVWVVVESALLRSGTNANRGQLLAAYMTVYYLGTVLGQLMLGVVPTAVMQVLPWATSLMVLAIMPLLFARFARPESHASVPMWAMLRRRSARLGIHGCVISGAVLGSLYGLLPLYLAHKGMSDANVGLWMALLVSAGIMGQWPIGRLADRFGRIAVLRVQVSVVILGCMAMLGNYGVVPALFTLGCAGFTLYPVAMSWACETAAPHELVAMNQALLMSYTIGSLAGPATVAALMQQYSDDVLFVMIAGIALVYLLMLMKKTDHHHALPAA
ncbi:MFS transporter [Hafnia paralvei]|uniref:MFS transporter n=1 Tax=Hafnia paralvei TaxID=546367 RepID=UPI000DF15F2E|nr:MFS transporter [Hafnia paralvei]RDA61564.1 MFS transporter [Hafnia paralvei]RDA63564.1 MFS transporter [Hafnia paralvei]RDA65645.1 MFS transporter [Hafnia paralvei]RDA74303.1 MFS transporter [Hafnia paralvei]RDA77312.1 MFS transporter [Hafnia paralvei]